MPQSPPLEAARRSRPGRPFFKWMAGSLGVAASLALGCGILTIVPLDQIREGNPAGRLFGGSHPPYRSGEVIFSHEPHSFVECATCHASGSGGAAGEGERLPSMAKCLECHNGDEASNACEACHQLERLGRKPASHDGEWPRRHGREAGGESYQCALCHAEPECQGCHSIQKPQSHTLRFLRSTHGRMANHDRSSCGVCHQADFCENCHSHPPPDHTPSFLAGGHKQVARLRARSCLTCHRFEADCSPCHHGV